MQSGMARPVTYLIRTLVTRNALGGGVQLRYLVERVADPPERRVFDNLNTLLAFLHEELARAAVAAATEPTDNR